MKKFLATTAIALCLSSGIYLPYVQAQNSVISKEAETSISQKFEALQNIMWDGSSDDLKIFIQNGFDVNSVYQCNMPLNMAVKSLAFAFGSSVERSPDEAIKKVKLLISSGADVNKEPCTTIAVLPLSSALQLPLQMYKLEENFKNAIEEEIKLDTGNDNCLSGAIPKPCKDLTAEDKEAIMASVHETYNAARQAFTPYMMDIIRTIVDNGADVNKKDSKQRTSLHIAASNPHEFTIEPLTYLISKGADVNAKDMNGNTPLFFAYSSNDMAAVDLLIKSGADTTIQNNDGYLYNQVTGWSARVYSGNRSLPDI